MLGIVLLITRAMVVGASLAMQQRTQERWHIGDGQAVPLSISCETRRIEEALRSAKQSGLPASKSLAKSRQGYLHTELSRNPRGHSADAAEQETGALSTRKLCSRQDKECCAAATSRATSLLVAVYFVEGLFHLQLAAHTPTAISE